MSKFGITLMTKQRYKTKEIRDVADNCFEAAKAMAVCADSYPVAIRQCTAATVGKASVRQLSRG
jgi:hypothetical protein